MQPAQAQDSESTVPAREGNVTQRPEAFGDGQVASIQAGQRVRIEGDRLALAERAAGRGPSALGTLLSSLMSPLPSGKSTAWMRRRWSSGSRSATPTESHFMTWRTLDAMARRRSRRSRFETIALFRSSSSFRRSFLLRNSACPAREASWVRASSIASAVRSASDGAAGLGVASPRGTSGW